jgi:hypothetical protein
MENEGSRQTAPSDEYLRTHTVGELKPLSEPIVLVDYDSQWPETFRNEAEKIGSALGRRVLKLEHVGSTSVPCLLAKPALVQNSGSGRRWLDFLSSVRDVIKRRAPHSTVPTWLLSHA